MTNKMPVVGKGYRHSELEANGVLSGWFMNQSISFGIFDFDDGREMEVRGLALKDFFSVFEELPDSNSQETEKVHICNSFCSCEQKGNEVERALDNLKLKLSENSDEWDGWCESNYHYELFSCIKQLIIALEAERKPFFKIREEGHFEGSPPSAETYAKYGMSKPEPKIDMKEERVEPVSIWKDVGDLLYDSALSPEQINIFEIIIEGCEQMQKDIEELKRNNK